MSRNIWKKSVTMVPRDRVVGNQSKQGVTVVHHSNKTTGQAMSAASFYIDVMEHKHGLWFLGSHFDRMLACKMHTKSAKLKCGKGLSTLKAMAVNSVICSFCIRLCCSASLTRIWMSQTCPNPTCCSLTGCRMRPWESFWELQKAEQLRHLYQARWPTIAG